MPRYWNAGEFVGMECKGRRDGQWVMERCEFVGHMWRRWWGEYLIESPIWWDQRRMWSYYYDSARTSLLSTGCLAMRSMWGRITCRMTRMSG